MEVYNVYARLISDYLLLALILSSVDRNIFGILCLHRDPDDADLFLESIYLTLQGYWIDFVFS